MPTEKVETAKQILARRNNQLEQLGIVIAALAVIYLPDNEGDWIPCNEKWRQVRFEHGHVDFTHERAWRLPGDLDLRKLPGFYILIWNPSEVSRLKNIWEKYRNFRGFFPMEHMLEIL